MSDLNTKYFVCANNYLDVFTEGKVYTFRHYKKHVWEGVDDLGNRVRISVTNKQLWGDIFTECLNLNLENE